MRRLVLPLVLLTGLSACGTPESDLPPLEQAQQALDQGDGLGAEIILRQMLEDGADRSDVAAYLGQAELVQGQLAEARLWLGDRDFGDASRGHGFHMLGRLEFREDNLAAAGQAFDEAYNHLPDDADLWVDVGRLRFRGGEQAQAIAASKRAVELEPQNPAALQFRAQLVRDAEGLAAAIPWFEAALEQNPENLELLGDYAATLGDLGRAKDMLAAVRRMAQIDDRNPRILYLQAVLAARAENFDLARSLLQRAEPAMGEVPAFMLLSGIVDMQNGNFESAAQELDRLAAMQPDNIRVRHLLARAIALGLNEGELIHRFAAAARRPSASPYLRLTVARAYEAGGDRAAAATLIDNAQAGAIDRLYALQGGIPLSVARLRQDRSGSNTLALVRGQIASGSTYAAVREADTFVKRFAGSADAMSLAGDAYRARGDTAQALEYYRSASEIRRTWPLAKRMVAAYRAAGQNDEAAQLLHSHVRGDPGNTEAAAELARVVASAGDWARAAMLIDHALDHGGARDPQLWGMRAIAARQLGDDELAYDAAIYAYALQPMNPDATGLLASLLVEYDQADLAAKFAAKLQGLTR